MKDVGSRIKQLREKYNFTQEQLAEKLNISKSALWNYENNKREIPLNLIVPLGSLFGADILREFSLDESGQQVSNISNIDMENKIKILELENNYLKNTVSNLEQMIELQKQLINNYENAIKSLDNIK